MGMSAAQAKLLSLTARRSDINYQLSSLMRGKLDLMTQASNAADMLADSKRNNNIFVLTTSDNTQTELSFNSLSKEGLTIVDAKGRTIVPSSYKTNPKGLTSILPASHPSVKSYDGDFVVKNKLNKNYVSIPQNQIPIFDNSKDFQQKYVKKFETVKTDNLTQITDSNSVLALTSGFGYTNVGSKTSATEKLNLEQLYNNLKTTNYVAVLSKNGNFLNNDKTNYSEKTIQSSQYNSSGKFSAAFQEYFKTEFTNIDNKDVDNNLNKNLGASYTAYYNRKFQSNVSWNDSLSKVNHHKADYNTSNEIQYVSNAEQFITALLKDAKMEGGKLESNANIMLLNDIDLDDMLQDNSGNGGLKKFIQDEISSLELDCADESKKTAYNNAMNTFSNVTNIYNDDNWANNKNNICNMFENLATAYGISISNLNPNASGSNIIEQINSISDSALGNCSSAQKQFINNAKDLYKLFNVIENDKNDITLSNGAKLTKNECSNWSKLSSQITAAAAAAVGGTKSKKSGIDASVLANVYAKYFSGGTSDKFDESFTNFIQIDKFTGAIGGSGFAINNLKMASKEAASMFGTLECAVLDGIWMDNANVISTNNSDDIIKKTVILAQEVTNNGKTTISNISARGNQGRYSAALNISKLTSSDITSGNNLLIAEDNRWYDNMDGGIKIDDRIDVDFAFHTMLTDVTTTGWTFKNMNTGRTSALAKNKGGEALRSFYLSDMERLKYSSDSDLKGINIGDVQVQGRYRIAENNGRNLTGGYISNITDSNNNNYLGLTQLLIQNSILDNSKIKFFQKNEGVQKYVEGSSNEISDWDADIDWDEWEYVDDTVNDDGTVALVKKHGEETEEYLSVMSLLEFYKEQGVNIDINEDRESGFLTYSAYGYSVDVEYKDDLEKYNSDPYLYKVENNDSSLLIYERDKVNDVDISQLVFVDDIEALLDKNIKNGVWFIQGASVSDAAKFERKSLDEIGISETTDENANNIAQAEYERKMRDIELQEEKFDAQITELENTLKGIEQEIENQQKIVKQNIQSSFSTFAS